MLIIIIGTTPQKICVPKKSYLPFIMANATVPLIMAIDAKIMRTI
jgi:hypothetical protein